MQTVHNCWRVVSEAGFEPARHLLGTGLLRRVALTFLFALKRRVPICVLPSSSVFTFRHSLIIQDCLLRLGDVFDWRYLPNLPARLIDSYRLDCLDFGAVVGLRVIDSPQRRYLVFDQPTSNRFASLFTHSFGSSRRVSAESFGGSLRKAETRLNASTKPHS